ncbi:hypothetical protein H4582DRAFT_1929486 [Lactarius indigo]|nr:hypothetical protein H4582DRAFT_1929486 [Lactarius indigo]
MSAYLSFMCASALIILRVAVLWNRNKIATAFACTVWVCNTAVCAYSLTSFHGGWKTPPETTSNLCAVLDTVHGRISVLSTFTTDLILLVLMLTGLKRWKHAPKTRGIWRLLCNQGLIWVMIVTLAEVPPTVFILLNLNGIFQASARKPATSKLCPLSLTAVGAARIYRGLVDYPAFDSSAKMVNEPHDALASPISHQTYQAKKQHDAEGRSVVLGTLPVKTSGGSEVPRGETFEGGNVV